MEHVPPPLFRTGPSPLARLVFFSMLSLILLIADARFNYLPVLRDAVAIIVYPLQRVAAAPFSIARSISEFFVTRDALREANEQLSARNRELLRSAQELAALEQENTHLRGLLDIRERHATPATSAQILYAARDPFSRKIMIDRGTQRGATAGRPVVDSLGVIGQITRTYPWLSEVTLITEKGHMVPVMNLRTGFRAVLAGTGSDILLELRFIPLAADFAPGDKLVTSGVDGVYPPGLPVAEVTTVERDTALLFATIGCKPAAGVNHRTQVLVLDALPAMPDRPPAEEAKPASRKKRR